MADTAPWSTLRSRLFSLFSRSPKSNLAIVDLAEFERAHVVLDIGCGPGVAVRAAADHVERAVGVDRAPAMVEIATSRSADVPNAEFKLGSAEALPFDDATFDRVWTIRAFHHWEDRDAGLREVKRVLKPGGRFLIIERQSNGKHGLNQAGASALGDALRAAGFSWIGVGAHGKEIVVTATV